MPEITWISGSGAACGSFPNFPARKRQPERISSCSEPCTQRVRGWKVVKRKAGAIVYLP